MGKMKHFKGLLLICMVLFLFSPVTLADNLTDEERIINAAATLESSTVIIDMLNGIGTGFYISANEIITNMHVVKDNSVIITKGSNGKSCIGNVIYQDKEADLALIKSNCSGIPLKVAQSVRLGQSALVMGNPLDEFFLSKGVVSSVRNEGYILHDAVTDHGNSGGPVVNLNGEIIGVTKGFFTENDRMSAAISIKALNQFLIRANKEKKEG